MFKRKITITKDNYKQVMLTRAIVLCWTILIGCFIVKICGGNFFNAVCEDEKVVKLCNTIDNSFWKYVYTYILYIVSNFILISAICSRCNWSWKEYLINIIIFSLCWTIKLFNIVVGTILDIAIVEVVLPFIYCKVYIKSTKSTIFRVIIGVVNINLFQLVSLFVRNLGAFKILDDSVIILFIMSIDYYIMLVIYLLYSLRLRGGKNMGLIGVGWFKDEIEKLKLQLDNTTDKDERQVIEQQIKELEEQCKQKQE